MDVAPFHHHIQVGCVASVTFRQRYAVQRWRRFIWRIYWLRVNRVRRLLHTGRGCSFFTAGNQKKSKQR